jgi:hypothetical protein
MNEEDETASIKISICTSLRNHLEVYGYGKRYIGPVNKLEGVADFVHSLDKKMINGDCSLPPEIDVSELPEHLKIPVFKKILETSGHYF